LPLNNFRLMNDFQGMRNYIHNTLIKKNKWGGPQWHNVCIFIKIPPGVLEFKQGVWKRT
jgi:hypothetical protein